MTRQIIVITLGILLVAIILWWVFRNPAQNNSHKTFATSNRTPKERLSVERNGGEDARVEIPSWLDAMWAGIKPYLTKTCPPALDQSFVDKLGRQLIEQNPPTLDVAMRIIDQACTAASQTILSPTKVNAGLPPGNSGEGTICMVNSHPCPPGMSIPVDSRATPSGIGITTPEVDYTMDDRDPGWGYGKFYSPVIDDNFVTIVPKGPWPVGVSVPGKGISSADIL